MANPSGAPASFGRLLSCWPARGIGNHTILYAHCEATPVKPCALVAHRGMGSCKCRAIQHRCRFGHPSAGLPLGSQTVARRRLSPGCGLNSSGNIRTTPARCRRRRPEWHRTSPYSPESHGGYLQNIRTPKRRSRCLHGFHPASGPCPSQTGRSRNQRRSCRWCDALGPTPCEDNHKNGSSRSVAFSRMSCSASSRSCNRRATGRCCLPASRCWQLQQVDQKFALGGQSWRSWQGIPFYESVVLLRSVSEL